MPIEYAPPKYALIVNALQARIEDGTYAPGAMLPSETALMLEFGVSRPTVVRSLEFLRQHGWIETQQGKGRFVRHRPANGGRGTPRHATDMLTLQETGKVQLLDVTRAPAPVRVAAVLNLPEGSATVARRRLTSVDGLGPVELSTVYVPADLAAGNDAAGDKPLRSGVVAYLSERAGIEFDYATERISARAATAEESRVLGIARRDCVLTVLFALHDRTGTPRLAVDSVLPPSRHELEDVFPLA